MYIVKIVKLNPAVIFTVLIAVVMGMALFTSKDFPLLARIYPLLIGSFVLVMAILSLVTELSRKGGEKGTGDTGSGAMDLEADTSLKGSVRAKKGIMAFGWFSAAYLAIWLLGFKIGVTAFLITYVSLRGRVRWYSLLGLVACLVSVLVFFDVVLGVYWPSGLLEMWLGDSLPWLF